MYDERERVIANRRSCWPSSRPCPSGPVARPDPPGPTVRSDPSDSVRPAPLALALNLGPSPTRRTTDQLFVDNRSPVRRRSSGRADGRTVGRTGGWKFIRPIRRLQNAEVCESVGHWKTTHTLCAALIFGQAAHFSTFGESIKRRIIY